MKKIHFIGIGGIGMSALAQYYLSEGYRVSGSDLVSSEITDFLKEKNIEIKTGGTFESLIEKNLGKVVYTPSLQENNSELIKARRLNIPTLKYPQA